MKFFKNGKYIPQARHFKKSYKSLYEIQLTTNKGLLIAIAIILLFSFLVVVGADQRVRGLNNEIKDLKSQVDNGLNVATKYAEYSKQLENDLATCSAKIKTSKLSNKAKAHMKQQPTVAEKIKTAFSEDWPAAIELFSRESSLNPLAINPSSQACGLVQSLPCSKLTTTCALSDVDCQIQWGKKYIAQRYGSVSKALAFHDAKGWY